MLATRIVPTSTCSIIIASATIVTIHTQRPRALRTRHATSAITPASAFAADRDVAPDLVEVEECRHGAAAAAGAGRGASSCCTTSNCHRSLCVLDRALRVVRLVTVLERGAVHPVLEVVLRRPARVHEERVAVVGGLEQLERLEARRLRHLTGPRREAPHQLVGPLLRHRDRVDLDDSIIAPAPCGTRCGSALVAQEALDLRRELVAARQLALVDLVLAGLDRVDDLDARRDGRTRPSSTRCT